MRFIFIYLFFLFSNKFWSQEKNVTKLISPKENFYLAVNQNWLDSIQLISEKRFGNKEIINQIIKLRKINCFEQIIKNPSNLSEKKLKQLYNLYIDQNDKTITINKLKYDIEKVLELKNKKELIQHITTLHTQGNYVLYKPNVKTDWQVSSKKNVTIINAEIDNKNIQNIIPIANKVGISTEKIKEETQKTQVISADLKNILAKEPLKITLKQAEELYYNIQIADFLKKFKLTNTDFIEVENPEYFKKLNQLFDLIPLEIWKSYLIIRNINQASKFLEQTTKSPEHFLEIIQQYNINQIIEQKYIQNYVNSKQIDKVEKIILELKTTFIERINQNNWLQKETKENAILKIQNTSIQVATPKNWKNIDSLIVDENSSFYQNLISSQLVEIKEKIKLLDQKTTNSYWEIPVYATNIHYNPINNTIIIPAGIMEAPYFKMDLNELELYSRIGILIAHEMIHILDIKNPMANWYDINDVIWYKLKEKEIQKIYTELKTINGLKSQTEFTCDEDIADLGGLYIAYYTFLNSNEFKVLSLENQNNAKKQFFFNFAQIHRIKYTNNELKIRLMNDNHSIPEFRVNGTLKNFEEFQKTFNILPENEMYEKNSVLIW
jgi:putative endopeptidase